MGSERCQADAYDAATFGPGSKVPTCDGEARYKTGNGYMLCEGCVMALRFLLGHGPEALVALGDLEIRRAP